MGLLSNDKFICLDCEATGLDPKEDRVIEIAACVFTYDGILDSYETLIDPECDIPKESQAIHHISKQMVEGKPLIKEVLSTLFKFTKDYIIVGHGIGYDLAILTQEARRHQIPCHLESAKFIDTLRLARLYGESHTNSLEGLRKHFHIQAEGAHRAMNDVKVNIDVFKHLSTSFKTTAQLMQRLEKPIQLKNMPLGKHKARKFAEIPQEYLQWAANKDFDQDLLFSIRSELKKRKQGNRFHQHSNPFTNL